MALLPSFFILQSGSKYLSLTENVPPGLPSGLVKFDEEQIWSPRTKFAAEPSESGDGRFVHIRSLYNNKYLVKKQNDERKSWFLVASAKKPEEDTASDSCTLFEPHSLKDDGPTSVRLRHVLIDDEKSHNSVHVTLSSSSSSSSDDGVDDDKKGMLLALAASPSSGSVFGVIDRASLVVLPTRIAIKWDGKYLRSRDQDWLNYERFEYVDITDPLVFKVLYPTADGNYRIKDSHWDRFFKYQVTWIWANGQENEISKDTKFSFVHIENTVFGIRSLANNNFCGALSVDFKDLCLNAYYSTLSYEARLTIEERVLKREISDIKYRLSDARTYGEQPIEVDTQITSNNLTDTVTTSTLTFTETHSTTTSWSNSETINFGVSVSMSVQEIPFISELGIEMHTDYTSTHEWGVSKTTETSRQTSHSVPVNPGKACKVTLMATMGKCDVPFNYTQRDLLLTGEWEETKKYDGLFTGVNNYKFVYKAVEIDPY
uniref:uncharacterized protein LOC122607848 n=1 Tax=Erigeron canadensis TaxID=72917 RepID=UPI001CB90721|nr:uncharacterized protein LOC122607848 [Erigeron canadensis]